MSEVWFNKYRPRTFSDVVGQEVVKRTLSNAVAQRRVSHAYLFAGDHGTGKTSVARILTRAINCEDNASGEPCGKCHMCRLAAAGTAPDLVEMDAASNRSIDDIRSLRDKVEYLPTESLFRTYLLDEAHQLTPHAFDALLKTLEEPPEHVVIILATTELEKIPETIISRCQLFLFQRIKHGDVLTRLKFICEKESVSIPDGGLNLIVKSARGSLRDAIGLLEQIAISTESNASIEEVERILGLAGVAFAQNLVHRMFESDLKSCLEIISDAYFKAVNPKSLQRLAIDYLRSLLAVKSNAEALLDVSMEEILTLREVAAGVNVEQLVWYLQALSDTDYRNESIQTLPLELAVAEAILKWSPAEDRSPVAVAMAPEPAFVPEGNEGWEASE